MSYVFEFIKKPPKTRRYATASSERRTDIGNMNERSMNHLAEATAKNLNMIIRLMPHIQKNTLLACSPLETAHLPFINP